MWRWKVEGPKAAVPQMTTWSALQKWVSILHHVKILNFREDKHVFRMVRAEKASPQLILAQKHQNGNNHKAKAEFSNAMVASR